MCKNEKNFPLQFVKLYTPLTVWGNWTLSSCLFKCLATHKEFFAEKKTLALNCHWIHVIRRLIQQEASFQLKQMSGAKKLLRNANMKPLVQWLSLKTWLAYSSKAMSQTLTFKRRHQVIFLKGLSLGFLKGIVWCHNEDLFTLVSNSENSMFFFVKWRMNRMIWGFSCGEGDWRLKIIFKTLAPQR